MGLTYSKDKIKDHLTQMGSVDPQRNISFEAGAQFQFNLDNAEHTKLEEENKNLRARVEELEAKVAKKKSK